METYFKNKNLSQSYLSLYYNSLSAKEKASIIFKIKYQKQKIEQAFIETNIDIWKIAETIREFKLKKSLINSKCQLSIRN